MNPETQNTLIATLGTIAVALIGTPAGLGLIRRSKAKRLESTNEAQKNAIALHATDPNAWVAIVTKDAAEARDDARQAREEAVEARAEASRLRTAFDDRDREERHFRVALGRWHTSIARGWGIEETMPYPDEADRAILAEVIPTMLEVSRPRPSKKE